MVAHANTRQLAPISPPADVLRLQPPYPDHHLASAAADRATRRLARLTRRRPPLSLRLRRGVRPSRSRLAHHSGGTGSGSQHVVSFQCRGRGHRRIHGGRDREARRDFLERLAHHSGGASFFLVDLTAGRH
jgi:hypothetical protein